MKMPDNLLEAAEAEVLRRPSEFSIRDLAGLARTQALAKQGFYDGIFDEVEKRIARSHHPLTATPKEEVC